MADHLSVENRAVIPPDLQEAPLALLPSEVDLQDVEPPWDAFVDLAVSTFKLTRSEARRLIEQTRATYIASRQ